MDEEGKENSVSQVDVLSRVDGVPEAGLA